jgi:hypothetical protein
MNTANCMVFYESVDAMCRIISAMS